MRISIIYILIIMIVLTILISSIYMLKKKSEKYIPEPLIQHLINIIVYSPLETRDIIEIINKNFSNQENFKKKLKEIVGFLRFQNFSKYENYFRNEAKRYLEQDLFNEENILYILNEISKKIKENQVQTDDLD